VSASIGSASCRREAIIADANHGAQEPGSQVERINTADMKWPLAKTA